MAQTLCASPAYCCSADGRSSKGATVDLGCENVSSISTAGLSGAGNGGADHRKTLAGDRPNLLTSTTEAARTCPRRWFRCSASMPAAERLLTSGCKTSCMAGPPVLRVLCWKLTRRRSS